MTRGGLWIWGLGALACRGGGDVTRLLALPDAGADQLAVATPDAGSGVIPAPLLPGEYAIAVPALAISRPYT